ncbi:Hypothetical protein PFR_JS20-2_1892 [Propionibacterium freudenreichii]|nr:Hypothetical protein PFR_JS20-1_1884 [Propionibacterium freudenreichii]SCQ83052.1 Hypothetical protein PFR_JS20-2_1892 [Propionibacterium freudenreichii]
MAYLRLVILGLPFQLVVLASTGLLRGLQDARTPMAVAIGVNLTNIGLDALLIYGFGFGIRGSATATATAQAASCLVLVAVIARRARARNLPGGGVPLRPSLHGMFDAMSHGGWLVVRSLGLWISLTATTVVATRMGSLILAAHQVANSIWNFLSFSLDALAIASPITNITRAGREHSQNPRGGLSGSVMGLRVRVCAVSRPDGFG